MALPGGVQLACNSGIIGDNHYRLTRKTQESFL